MAQAITSSLRNVKAERICKIFGGHQIRKYGDGEFCRNCGMPKEKAEAENNAMSEIAVPHESHQ